MSFCVQYEGQVPEQHKEEFCAMCKEYGSAPEMWQGGQFMTDNWNHRGWETLRQAVADLAETYDCVTQLDCSFMEGDTDYVTTYYHEGVEFYKENTLVVNEDED